MADAKYNSAYLATRRAWAPVVARGEATCHETICLMPTRTIAPGSRWDLCHDPTGTRILGPGHRRCNRSEGATRGNKGRVNRFLKL
jgi:hypothetical protein